LKGRVSVELKSLMFDLHTEREIVNLGYKEKEIEDYNRDKEPRF
jgi:hypothetical protein